MTPAKITNLGAYRAARDRPATDLLAWHAAAGDIFVANLTAAFAWQRTLIRAFLGA